MKLEKIIAQAGVLDVQGSTSVEIAGIADDSRKVVPGGLFVAVKGFAGDGHAYIPQALVKGAKAIAYEEAGALEGIDTEGITLVKVENSRHAVAMMADAFYGHPSDEQIGRAHV